MKKGLISFVFLIVVLAVPKAQAQCDCGPLGSLAISLNVGTLGVGLEASSSLTPYLAGRIGVDAFAYTHKYNYEGFNVAEGTNVETAYTVPLKAKAKMFNAHALLDIFPFPDYFPAYLSAGVYVGTSDIIKVSGDPNGQSVEIGDLIINPLEAGGLVEAAVRTNVFKPYVGLGFGRTVPHSRLGFRCELGALFHGSPQIKVLTKGVDTSQADGTSGFNKFLKDFNVYPVLKLQLVYRFY
ncbi:hypothetical protein EZS27_034555 [termite gut metagenome]|uniref:Outer membrane protein beta-barrel domain-containing protein n=1 Tax=termite gut metagenome TaxID=433724 RepID=A0A5J4Q1X4_9ZZZZ